MTLSEYRKLRQERDEIISENRARRMRNIRQEPLPVPPKPEVPLVPVAYSLNGTYEGRLESADELPPGMILKWEPIY